MKMDKGRRPLGATWRLVSVAALVMAWSATSGCSDGALSLKGNYAEGGQIGGIGDEGPGDPGRVQVGGRSLQIDSPLPRQIVTREGIPVTGQAEGVDEITLNGRQIQVEDGTFSATVQASGEGSFEIVAQAESLPELRVPVTVDLSPPRIVVTNPPRGAFLVRGQQDTIQVQGQVADSGSGVASVTVNGQAVTVGDNGAFSANITPQEGTNFIKVEATDRAEQTAAAVQAAIYGSYSPWGQPADDAINVRMRPDGLSVLEDGLASTLAGDLLSGFGGNQGSDQVEIRGVSYGELEIDLIPANGYLDTRIRIWELVVEMAVRQRVVFFDVTITGDVRINPAELTAKLYLEPDGSGGLGARLTDADVRLRDFNLNLDGLASILEGLVEGTVEDLATDLLSDVLNEGILATLLDPGGLVQTFDMLGNEATFRLLVSEVGIDPQGITFGADSSVDMPPDPSVPPSPGVLTTASDPPYTPTPDRMIRLSLADDLINGLLGSIWRGGGLNIDIGALLAESGGEAPLDLNAGTFALLVGRELLDFADRDTPVGLKMRALLPPVARVQSADRGILNITIGDLLLDFSFQNPDGEVRWATVATQLIIDLKLTLDENGEIASEMSLTVEADLADEPLFDINDEVLERVMASLLEGLPDMLGDGGVDGLFGMGDMSNNDPGNVGVENLDIRPDGPSKDYMSIYLDFVPLY